MIVFAGAEPAVGTSSLAACFAQVRARESQRGVLLVDAHFDRPAQAGLAGVEPAPGLMDFLQGQDSPDVPVKETDQAKLQLVPAGRYSQDSIIRAESMFTCARWQHTLQDWRSKYDSVVIDAGPLLTNMSALELASQSVAVVVVAEWARTLREVLAEIRNRLEEIQANFLGVVVNQRESVIPRWIYKRL